MGEHENPVRGGLEDSSVGPVVGDGNVGQRLQGLQVEHLDRLRVAAGDEAVPELRRQRDAVDAVHSLDPADGLFGVDVDYFDGSSVGHIKPPRDFIESEVILAAISRQRDRLQEAIIRGGGSSVDCTEGEHNSEKEVFAHDHFSVYDSPRHFLTMRSMSANKPFNEPDLTLSRIYTKGGDKGETSLVGGQRVPKDALRIDAYGTVDELNAFIGMAHLSALGDVRLAPLALILGRVQHELFNLGSILATMPADVGSKQPRVTEAEVKLLEYEIDEMNGSLPSLRSFVLPGGTRLNTELHACRTICRRAERIAVHLSREEEVPEEAIRYLNRLSDALFVFSRWAVYVVGGQETLWQPNRAASGTA